MFIFTAKNDSSATAFYRRSISAMTDEVIAHSISGTVSWSRLMVVECVGTQKFIKHYHRMSKFWLVSLIWV
jgi:hypothetical protein